jgi:class 3 adenylate cyclase
MMDAVHRYEGTVNQVLGDGIMALFVTPIAHEDHAIRACYAALAMQVEGLVQVNALGPIPVKGLTEPVEVFELGGASVVRRRL